MTIEEKLEKLKIAISPDEAEDGVLQFELMVAETMILNKMYPFGYGDDVVVPPRYEHLQIKLAVELYSQRGADGQLSHTENGISRTYPTVSRILAQIIPHCGSVTTNA